MALSVRPFTIDGALHAKDKCSFSVSVACSQTDVTILSVSVSECFSHIILKKCCLILGNSEISCLWCGNTEHLKCYTSVGSPCCHFGFIGLGCFCLYPLLVYTNDADTDLFL